LDSLVAEIGFEGVQQTLSTFIAEADRRLKRFRQLACDPDRYVIELEAHALKGSAGNFGLRHLSETARALEHSAREITANNYAAALDCLEQSYTTARTYITKQCIVG
jgi:HPt (histidine-containing phosphotransfer) domain-containing protein